MKYETVKLCINNLEQSMIDTLSFWSKPLLLESFAKRDDALCYYLAVVENNKILALMPVFEKKKFGLRYLVQPMEYYYTPINFFSLENYSVHRKQNHRLMILKALAVYIKKEYFKINLRFERSIQDIRAFKWVGLKAEPLFTYIIKINEYSSEKLPNETRRQLNNKAKKELMVKECRDMKIYKDISINMLNRKKRSFRQIETKYINFLDELHAANLCVQYVVFKDDEPLTYNIILLDRQHKYIYGFLSATSDKGMKFGANIFCIDHIIKNHSDFEIFDFTGANTEKISFFKSQFNCDLKNYYKINKLFF